MVSQICLPFSFFYNEEPRPEYDPKTNKVNTTITANPPTSAINHKGIRPVLAILFYLQLFN